MIVVLGDIHFRDDKPYFVEICNNFISWFSEWELNNNNNTLILAGDLVERNLLTGTVVDFLERFIKNSNFKEVHIIVGNHDKKKQGGETQLAYEFYKRKPNIKIYEQWNEVVIEGKKVLMLPYFTGNNCKGFSMADYYSSISENKLFSNDYDLTVGHFCGEDTFFAGNTDCIKNLDKIKSKKICLGHIHTRLISPHRYIGSIFAGKKTENDPSRAAWYLDENMWKEYPLPIFNEFLTVTYPNPLPRSNAQTKIYTILNCPSESIARSIYKDIYIRKVIRDYREESKSTLSDFEEGFTSIRSMSIPELFDGFIKEQKDTLGDNIISECKKALHISD